jgi:hypothetical protein
MPVDINIIHNRLGHAHKRIIQATCDKYNLQTKNNLTVCPNCAIAKAKQTDLNRRSEPRSTEKGDRINMDVSSALVTSFGGAKFWLLLQDDYTGYLWNTFLKYKSELPEWTIK